jgi:MerR family transcriptional regulator/heat shock protein HspR
MALYVISVAAELAGLHAQTLRIYERKGLVEPARTKGGSRRYSELDIARLQRISELTEEGMNLAGVRRVLELEEEVRRLQLELEATREAARRQIAEAQRSGRRDLVPLRQDVILWSERHPRRPDR